MKRHLLIACNLGLGDCIICNPIIRHYAAQNDLVCVPVKYGNVPSVQYMLRDLENILIRPVEDHDEAMMFAERVWKGEKLLLGQHGGPFDASKFDQEFYRQAGLPFYLRWDGWFCERDEQAEAALVNAVLDEEDDEFLLFHHDERFPLVYEHSSLADVVMPSTAIPVKNIDGAPLMAWWRLAEMATEIHAINSSFALFIDSIVLTKPKLYLHEYARPGGEVPTFRKDWIKLT